MPLQVRDRTDWSTVDLLREFIAAGTGLTASSVLDAETLEGEVLPQEGSYITVLLGSAEPMSTPDVEARMVDGKPRMYALSWFRSICYIDFVRYADPVTEAQVFQAWMGLPAGLQAAEQLGISIMKVEAVRDVTEIVTGQHERRAQMDLRFGIVIETPLVENAQIDRLNIRGVLNDQLLRVEEEIEIGTSVDVGVDLVPQDGAIEVQISGVASSWEIQYQPSTERLWTDAHTLTCESKQLLLAGLTNDTEYAVRVRPVDEDGDPGSWTYASVAAPRESLELPQAPGTPVGRSRFDGGSTYRAEWTWTEPSENGGSPVTGYQWRYRTGVGTDWRVVQDTPARQAVMNNLIYGAGTEIDFQVRAYSAVGYSDWSGVGSLTIEAAEVPQAPTISSIEGADESVQVNWTEPSEDGGSDILDYLVQYSPSDDDFAEDATSSLTVKGSADEGKIMITGLTNGTEYDVRMRARNMAGSGAWSTVGSATAQTVPDAPVLSVTQGDEELDFSWTEPEDGGNAITGYRLEIAEDANFAEDVDGNDLTTTTHTETGLTNGTRYWARVRAVNAVGDGAYSERVNEMPSTSPGAPTATPVQGDGRIDVHISIPDTGGAPVTGVEVQLTIDSTFGSSLMTVMLTGDVSAAFLGLTNGTLYYARARLTNRDGTGSWSSIGSTTPMAGSYTATASETFTWPWKDFSSARVTVIGGSSGSTSVTLGSQTIAALAGQTNTDQLVGVNEGDDVTITVASGGSVEIRVY